MLKPQRPLKDLNPMSFSFSPALSLLLYNFLLPFSVSDFSLPEFGVVTSTSDGLQYTTRTAPLTHTPKLQDFRQTEDRLHARVDPEPDNVVIFLRLANVPKAKMLGLGPEGIQAATMVSLRQSILGLPQTFTVSLTVIYDHDSMGEKCVAETQKMVELVFSGVSILREVVHVVPQHSGNRATNLLQYQLSTELENNPIVYFLEEDYLHSESALRYAFLDNLHFFKKT